MAVEDATSGQSAEHNVDRPVDGSGTVEPISPSGSVPTPGFSGLAVPEPAVAAPPPSARAIAFIAVLVGGLLGGLVGYGIADILYPDSIWASVGALAGAATGSAGLGVLANLTLRAMNEWKTAAHPESDKSTTTRSSSSNP